MKTIRALAILGLVLAQTACEEILAPVLGTSTLIVQNGTGSTVHFMYISSCSSSDWGSDQLGANEVIAPGASRSWTVDPDCYDVRAVFSDGAEVTDRLTVEPNTDFTWTITD